MMLAYKQTKKNNNLIKYEVGKTYELIEGELHLRLTSFSFSKDFLNIDKYSDISLEDKSTIIYRVNILGKIIKDDYCRGRYITDKMRVLREIPRSEWEKLSKGKIKFDENNNNLIYKEDSNGFWEKFRYNKNNNLIYYENYHKSKLQYDENNNLIYREDPSGYWIKYQYKNNNLIYQENSNGTWSEFQYDENNNEIYQKSSDGFWIKHEHDENNNLIYWQNSEGKIERIKIS